MRGGDLSNDMAPYVAFSFDRVVKRPDGKLDPRAKGLLLQFMESDKNVLLITEEDKRKCMAFCMKWGVPWNQVIEVDSVFEIPDVCREIDVLWYWDTSDKILSSVRARGGLQVKVERWIRD